MSSSYLLHPFPASPRPLLLLSSPTPRSFLEAHLSHLSVLLHLPPNSLLPSALPTPIPPRSPILSPTMSVPPSPLPRAYPCPRVLSAGWHRMRPNWQRLRLPRIRDNRSNDGRSLAGSNRSLVVRFVVSHERKKCSRIIRRRNAKNARRLS